MKQKFFSYLAVIVTVTTLANICHAEERKFEDYLSILKEKVGPTPYIGEVGDLQTIREDKKPGQRFLHMFNMTITGKATAMSKRLRGWWNSESSVSFCHETNLHIRETIISNQEQLNRGIVRSKFEVSKFSENLISAKAAFEFEGISSKTILRFVKEYGTTLKIAADGAVEVAETLTPNKYRPIVTLVGGAVTLMLNKGIDDIPIDGYIHLGSKAARVICPDYNSFCTKISNLDDAVMIATWECGKGFTELQIQSRADEDDKELLTKLIYRSNPAVSGRWYPKKTGSVKTVDATEIGGMIFTSAVESDKIEGQIAVKNRGPVKSPADVEDLKAHNNNVKLTEIGIMENGINSINIKAKHESIESLSASFIPHGSFFIVQTPNLPKFVRRADIEGKFDVRIDNKKGIFQELNMDGRSGRVKVSYFQVYLGRNSKGAGK